MASRILSSNTPRFTQISSILPRRTFHTTRLLRAEPIAPAAPVVVKKPVGAFRGGLFGFLLGSTLAGASVYYYILEEYKVSNELLTEDIYALQAAVQRIHGLVSELETKIAATEKKR